MPHRATPPRDVTILRKRFLEMLQENRDALLVEVRNLVERGHDAHLPPWRIEQLEEWISAPDTKNLPAKIVLTLGEFVYQTPPGMISSAFKKMTWAAQMETNSRVAEIAAAGAGFWRRQH